MKDGWIRIHRRIQDCFLWNLKTPFDERSAWIDLLLLANHEDKKILFDGEIITVGRGQRVTSLHILADRWHWSVHKVKNYMNLLESDGMIVRKSDKRGTLLTIVNYDAFQSDGYTAGTPRVQSGHAVGTPRALNKNDKNDKNDKKENIRHRHGEYQNVLLSDEDLEKLKAEIPEDTLTKLIEELSSYMASTGKTYKSHLATLRNWARRRKEDNNKKPVEKFGEFQSKGTDLDELQRRLTVN